MPKKSLRSPMVARRHQSRASALLSSKKQFLSRTSCHCQLALLLSSEVDTGAAVAVAKVKPGRVGAMVPEMMDGSVKASTYYRDLFGFSESDALGPQGLNSDATNVAVATQFEAPFHGPENLRPHDDWKLAGNPGKSPRDIVQLKPKKRGSNAPVWSQRMEGFQVGRFWTPSLRTLEAGAKEMLEAGRGADRAGMKSDQRDLVDKIQRLPPSSFGAQKWAPGELDVDAGWLAANVPLATIQGASQLNALEQASWDVDPQGIVVYASDMTQGPAVAISGFAGALWRNHFVVVQEDGTVGRNQPPIHLAAGVVPRGQTKTRQVNFFRRVWRKILAKVNGLAETDTKKIKAAEKKADAVRNGYVMVDKARPTLEAAAAVLDENAIEDLFESEMRVGLQEDTVYTGRRDVDGSKRIVPMNFKAHLIASDGGRRVDENALTTQVFASGIPFPKKADVTGPAAPFYRMFLRAQYRATFAAALQNALRHGYALYSYKLYLTGLGAGAWMTDDTAPTLLGWIHEAIADAMYAYRNCGLDVTYIVGDAASVEAIPAAVKSRYQAGDRGNTGKTGRGKVKEDDVCGGGGAQLVLVPSQLAGGRAGGQGAQGRGNAGQQGGGGNAGQQGGGGNAGQQDGGGNAGQQGGGGNAGQQGGGGGAQQSQQGSGLDESPKSSCGTSFLGKEE